MDLAGKIAVVTGAGGAIGSALVAKLKDNKVFCIEVDKDFEMGCDFTKSESILALFGVIKDKFPIIDFVFNVAGIGVYKKIEDLTENDWQNTFTINVTAPFLISQTLLPNLKKTKSTMIFNIGSGMGVVSASERTAYCSSKFALRGLSLSLSKELKNQDVDVVLLTLGSVMTPFGTGGIDKRKELERNGKKYLTVQEVTNKIIDIAKSEVRDEEYVMYPDGYI